jgi:hypothetical protein
VCVCVCVFCVCCVCVCVCVCVPPCVCVCVLCVCALQTVPGQIDSEFIGLSTVCCDVGESGKVGVIELHETGVPGGY